RRADAEPPPSHEGALRLHRRRARARAHDRRRARGGPQEQGAARPGPLPRPLRGRPAARPPHDGLLAGHPGEPPLEHHRRAGRRGARPPRGLLRLAGRAGVTGTPLKGVLVGFGKVAEAAHLPAFRGSPGFSLQAVVEADPARRQAAAAALPGARVYPTLTELLARERGLDFVDVAAPPWLHAPLALEALGAGLHVLCEKPLATSPSDLDALAAAARKAGRALVCVHNWKKAPLVVRLKELLDAGASGPVHEAHWHVLRTQPAADAGGGWRLDPARAGGGVVMDHGWHAFYLLSWLLGKRPTGAHAVLSPAARAEEEASVLADFGGVPASVRLSWRAPARGHWGLFRGPEGSVEMLDDRLILRRGEERTSHVFREALSAGSAHPEWFRDLLPDFADAVARPEARAAALEEALDAMKVVSLCYGAAPSPARKRRG
ncbi:Gfo/Idh/MocA family oxidoreductase, partial [bacterium]